MDFSLANKHSKDVEKRRREAKRKLEQQRKDEELQKVMEEGQRERDEQRMAEEQEKRRVAEEEALLNDGVRFLQRLRPYPTPRTDDKLVLPPSALETLERQGALDGGVLTFTVALPPGSGKAAGGLTHAGVAEFTAEEGTVGVPPRVALCLTKGSGLDSLAAVGTVEVRFTRLNRSAKSTVRFQPRGQGFHTSGKDAVSMDLEHVLLQSLRGHTALTEGDWLPIRHEGVTYELLVRELAPEPQLLLLDTDLTVEVLPSEQTEAEVRAEEERKAKEEAAAREAEDQERQRILRAEQKALALLPEPDAGPEVLQILVRLPEGGRIQRRFAKAGQFEHVLDWVESQSQTRVGTGLFCLVQKWPGHMREFGRAEAQQCLSALGFSRQEAFFLQRVGEAVVEASPEQNEKVPALDGRPAGLVEYWKPSAEQPVVATSADSSAWAAAEERAHASLDRRLEGEGTPTNAVRTEPALENLQGEELVDVFHRLVAFGMSPQEAAVASKKYSAQLRELGGMGFHDWPQAVRLLDKYQGRLLRVANAMAEEMTEGGTEPPPPVASSAATAPAPAAASVPVASTVTMPASEPNQAQAHSSSETAVDYNEKMTELAAMGFTDQPRNEVLLRKYAGRLERVIEALCSA